MWDLSQNDGPTANVLMHIIIYSTVYKKKHIFVLVFEYILKAKVLVMQWTLQCRHDIR